MHIIQEEIGLPVMNVTAVDGDDNNAVITFAPLPVGFGMTLGNPIRRGLLSSVPGAAITSMRIEGVQHEYAAMPKVRETVLDIGLNLKQLQLRKHSNEPEIITLKAKGPKTLTAKDLDVSSDIEIINPDTPIVTIEKGGSIDMQLTVEKGVGYVPASERNNKDNEPGLIYIDAIYSPVLAVNYQIEPVRVGQRTDLEKLVIAVETNGSLSAQEAVQFVTQLLKSYYDFFGSDQIVEEGFIADFSRAANAQTNIGADTTPVKESYTPIEILNLSPRTLNALINGGVGSIEQLTKCSEASLANFRGFGSKALDEVKDALVDRSLQLGSELVE
jgi:DNA-directed RNA polymerase subunit alpha